MPVTATHRIWRAIRRIEALTATWRTEEEKEEEEDKEASPSPSSAPFPQRLDPEPEEARAEEELDIRENSFLSEALESATPVRNDWALEHARRERRYRQEIRVMVPVERALMHEVREAQRMAEFLEELRVEVQEVEDGEVCAVCLAPFVRGDGSSSVVVRLPCHDRHVFHGSCVRRWLLQSPTCPLDRQVLIERGERPPFPSRFLQHRPSEDEEDWMRRIEWFEELHTRLTGKSFQEYWGDDWDRFLRRNASGSMTGG